MQSPNSIDDIIEIYKKDVDVSLLQANLRLTVEERLRKLQNFSAAVEELRKGTAKAIEESQ